MTRINCVPPSELHDLHLITEYRELPRVFNLVRDAILRGEQPNNPHNPSKYTLGKGHVRFFYPRCAFLLVRQASLITEMRNRGMQPSYAVGDLSYNIPFEWFGGWEPTVEAMALNRERIKQRSINLL